MVTKKKIQSIADEIRAFCADHADEKQAKKYEKFFTEGYDAYGVGKEQMREQEKVVIDQYKDELGLDGSLRVGDVLIQSGKYEEFMFAVMFLRPFKDQFTPDTFHRLGTWLETGARNWAHVDVLSGDLLTSIFNNKIIELKEMAPWRDSPSKWKRRAIPVSMLALLKTEKNFKPLLKFIEPIMLDEEKFVQQGLGWFLREAWKLQPEPVEAFLLKWKDSAPRKIYQYATEKMTKENKERFRKARK